MTLAVLVLLAGFASQAPERAFVEVTAERDAYFAHEPMKLSLVFGVEASFAETSMIQPFHRRLDVPVQLEAPWIGGFPGALALPMLPMLPIGERSDVRSSLGPQRSVSFALNDGAASATRLEDRTVDGRTFVVLALERTFLPTDAGELAIPAALLRFAYATRFAEDFVHGRVPVDRHDALVGSAPLVLAIRPLPEEGRPSEFTGAVGRLAVRAETFARELVAGESFELALIVEGEGNLELFAAPPLDRLEGFHFLGLLEEKGPLRRRITYHLAPESAAVAEVPPIRFAYFDTTPPASYRVAETAPIPLVVRAARASAPATRPSDAGARAQTSEAVDAEGSSTTPALLASIALALAALGGAALWLVRRGRAR